MTHTDSNILMPSPPPRLYDDRRMLNPACAPDWQNRRASKMRERRATPGEETVPGLSLVAPVQPSTTATGLAARPYL